MNKETLMMLLIIAGLVLNLITMILVIVLLSKNKSRSFAMGQQAFAQNGMPHTGKASAETGVVFCRNCGSQHDSTMKICPVCKTPRK